jgi:hypothetical protein
MKVIITQGANLSTNSLNSILGKGQASQGNIFQIQGFKIKNRSGLIYNFIDIPTCTGHLYTVQMMSWTCMKNGKR